MPTRSSRPIAARADTLVAVLREVRACQLCAPQLPLGARPILQLDRRARILIAGQAPGRKVHESGVPFSDVSGRRLRAWMGVSDATFYDPAQVAILPMGFCYPGTGISGDLPPRPECARTWRARLLALLPEVQLTLVIGQYAAAWHLPQAAGSTLTELVADWRRHWPQVLPMPHPSPRNQRWLRGNPWFAAEVLPQLQERVRALTVNQRTV